MAYTLGSKCAKNLCKRIVLLQLIIKNVVTFFLEHSVDAQLETVPYAKAPQVIIQMRSVPFLHR